MLVSLVYFTFFFAGFLTSEYLRFQSGSVIVVYAIAALSGVSFFAGLKKLKLIDAVWLLQALIGAIFGLLWFGMVFWAEDRFSKNKLTQSYNLEHFSELSDHCGIHIGGRIAFSLKSPIDSWKMTTRCRIEHWKILNKTKNICEPNSGCIFEVMERFGAKGNWSSVDRKFFYGLLKTQEDKYKFLLLDQKLIQNRKPLVEQIGNIEQFTSQFAVVQLEEEIADLEITTLIVSEIPPESEEIRPMIADLKLKVEKIKQLRADLEFLKQKHR